MRAFNIPGVGFDGRVFGKTDTLVGLGLPGAADPDMATSSWLARCSSEGLGLVGNSRV